MRNFLASGHGHGGPLLSSSPRTVLCRFLLFVDHFDNARGWRHGLVLGLGGLTLWLTVGKVALFEVCFVWLNLYK